MTSLLSRPTVKAVPCIKYVVEWDFECANWDENGQCLDTAEAHHRKVYLTKVAAYRHAAWGYIINRRNDRGCTRDECAFGKLEQVSADGDMEDTRCRYCNHDKVRVTVNRLARWLKWRDTALARAQEKAGEK